MTETKTNHLSIEWHDHEREPQCKPDPAYPTGKDIDSRLDGGPSCKTTLPYPAERCGLYVVRCDRCGMSVGITTAGRPDDPRSVIFNCKAAAAKRIDREPADESEHFMNCDACGQAFDMRRLDDVAYHEEPGHAPMKRN